MAPQNKANTSLVALSAKNSFSKSSPSPALKKQPNTLWVDLSSKLASNGKLTSDKHKKHLENNLCLYCGARDYKLDFCPKKQTMVTPKSHSASAAAFEKPFDLMHLLFPILIHSLFPLPLVTINAPWRQHRHG